MGLTRLAVKRPLTMVMMILGLVILGFRGFTLMQVERYPKVDFPFISVVVVFPGASPDDVETLVVKPIEDAVAGIPGIDYVQSVSNEGFGYVVAAFQEGVDGDQAAIDVERKVSAIKGNLPSDATEPSIVKADINAIPIMNLILSGPQSQDELFKLAEDEVKPLLQSVKGVASVSVSGGRNQIISVQVDGKKLSAYKLPVTSLSQAFATSNMAFPVGSLEEGRQKTTLRSVGSFQSLAEIERMVVSGAPSSSGGGSSASTSRIAGADTGGLVYLKDLATVETSFDDVVGYRRYNGLDTVSISIVPTSGANVIEVADAITGRIENLNQTLPGNTKLTIISDDSKFIKSSVAAVQEDLILAVLITGLVMLVFLHTLRSTFIVIMAIPTSLLSTFLVMWALGYSINVLTLLAMTLIIGILVDDSIVVLENIERHLKMRKMPKQAAIDGRQEIGWAAIAITLVDVVVYIPVAFTSGIVGQFFRAYGITIVAATLFSLLISFTLTPLLAAYFMKEESDRLETRGGVGKILNVILFPVLWVWNNFTRLWEAGFDALSNFYSRVIGLSLSNVFTQGLVIIIALTVFVGAIFFNQFDIPFGNYKIKGLGLVSSEFMPQEDDGKFTVTIQLPPGTSLEVTDKATRQIEQIILREVPETVSILSSVGSSASSSIMSSVTGGSNSATISVLVVSKNDRLRPITQIVEELRPAVSIIPDANVTVTMSSFMSMGTAAISVQVYGTDPNVLIDLSKQVEAIVRTTPNTIDVLNLDAVRAPETKIKLNRQRLSDLGISPAAVTGALRTAVTGSDVGDYSPEGQEKTQITLRLNEDSRENLEDLLQLPIGYLSGKPILLSQVAEIERSLTPAVIKRYDRQRILTISSGVIGSNSSGITNDIETRIKQEVVFPPEYGYRFSGMSEAQRESFADLFSALFLSIILIYMLLVALYQNFLQPLAIMFSLPLALIGVMGGLAVTQNSLNMFSMLGVIMLAGIVGRNSILLVDFANQLRERGMPRKQALVEAGRLRLRPIIMTSFALIFALLPVLFSSAEGSESRQPLAAVLIGGSATSGLLSLLVTPVTYNILEGLTDRAKSLFYLIVGRQVEKAVATTPPAADPAGEI